MNKNILKILISSLVVFGLLIFTFSGQTRLDFVNNLASVTGMYRASPTATLLANGQSDVTVYVGDKLNYTWNSINADTAVSSYTTSCNSGPNLFAGTLNGIYPPVTINSSLVGCNYVITYTVTQKLTGLKSSSTVKVHVLDKPAIKTANSVYTGTAQGIASTPITAQSPVLNSNAATNVHVGVQVPVSSANTIYSAPVATQSPILNTVTDDTVTTLADAKAFMDSTLAQDYEDTENWDEVEINTESPLTYSGTNSLAASVSKVLAAIFTKMFPGSQSIFLKGNSLSESRYEIKYFSNAEDQPDVYGCREKASHSYTVNMTKLKLAGAAAAFGPFDDAVTVTFDGWSTGALTVNGNIVSGNPETNCSTNVVNYTVNIPKGGSLGTLGIKENDSRSASLGGTLKIKNTWLADSVKSLLSSVDTDKVENSYTIISYPYGVKKIYKGTRGTSGTVAFFDFKKVQADSLLYGGTKFLIAMVHDHPHQSNPIIETLSSVIGMPPSVNGVTTLNGGLPAEVVGGADYDTNYEIQKTFNPSLFKTYVVDVAHNIWWYGVPSLTSLQAAGSIIANISSTPANMKAILSNGFLDPVKMIKKIYVPAGLQLGKTSIRSFDVK